MAASPLARTAMANALRLRRHSSRPHVAVASAQRVHQAGPRPAADAAIPSFKIDALDADRHARRSLPSCSLCRRCRKSDTQGSICNLRKLTPTNGRAGPPEPTLGGAKEAELSRHLSRLMKPSRSRGLSSAGGFSHEPQRSQKEPSSRQETISYVDRWAWLNQEHKALLLQAQHLLAQLRAAHAPEERISSLLQQIQSFVSSRGVRSIAQLAQLTNLAS